MNLAKGMMGLASTVFIAAVVAYAVSAPRNVDSVLNQDLAGLDGQSINEHIAQAKSDADQQQCETFSRLASEAWDRAQEQGTIDRDADTIAELDANVERYCNQ